MTKTLCPSCGSGDTGPGAGGYVFCHRCGTLVSARKIDPNIGDPEMGGFHHGTPEPIPSRFKDDEFFRGRRPRRNRHKPRQRPITSPQVSEANRANIESPSRETKPEGKTSTPVKKRPAAAGKFDAYGGKSVATLRSTYVSSAKAGLWGECEQIAIALLASELNVHEKADAFYALGYAREHAGELKMAYNTYKIAMKHDPEHARANKRSSALESKLKS